jgi:pyruvate formate lyase activating enzyme
VEGAYMKTALIVGIQKFCVHDGPGIRTTIFFKGCPLACRWCHNPESQSFTKEVLLNAALCTFCGQCQSHCSQQAIRVFDGKNVYDATKCNGCETCVVYCIHNAREIAGKKYSVNELIAEIEKDIPFYEQSGGGVTLSGGEVMSQIDFVEKLIQRCKECGISVVIDTCGYAPSENFMRIAKNVDLFLYDIKLVDAALHKKYTGQDNALILKNLQVLSDSGANINLRMPMIGNVNTEDVHISQMIHLIKDLSIHSINLLPYHDIAKGKYQKLDKHYDADRFFKPSDKRLEEIKARFEECNYKVQIGG